MSGVFREDGLAADTADVLAADTTDVLSAAEAASGGANNFRNSDERALGINFGNLHPNS